MKKNELRKQTESLNVNEQNPTRKQTQSVNVNEHFLLKHLPESAHVEVPSTNSIFATVFCISVYIVCHLLDNQTIFRIGGTIIAFVFSNSICIQVVFSTGCVSSHNHSKWMFENKLCWCHWYSWGYLVYPRCYCRRYWLCISKICLL